MWAVEARTMNSGLFQAGIYCFGFFYAKNDL
jgi:hypothetical protein